MPLVKIQQLGALGLITDRPTEDLPPNSWEVADHVEFQYGVVKSSMGYTSSIAVGSLSTTPHFILSSFDQRKQDYLVYASNTLIYGFFNGLHNNITRTAAGADVLYSASSFNAWQSCQINGNLILNNGTDNPQQWLSTSTTPRMANLTGWSATWKANTVRTFNNYLIAVNITKGTVPFPQMVKWSTSASLGQVPLSWDELSLTLDAGEIELADSPDECVDSLQLRDSHIIYKTRSTWGMRFIGFPNIFNFYKIFGNSGIMAKNCVAELGDQHYVLTQDDIIVHDGNSFRSLIDQRLKEEIFSNLDAETKTNSFLIVDVYDKIVIVGVPISSTYVNTLFIYHTRFDTWSKYPINEIYGMSDRGSIGIGATWDSDSGVWDADSSVWNSDASVGRLLIAGKVSSFILYDMFTSNLAESSSITSTVVKTGMSFVDQGFQQNDEVLKRINYMKPEISGSNGVAITINIGTKIDYEDPIDWGNSLVYTIGTSKELWFLATGRYFGVRFQSIGQDTWELKSYTLSIEDVGKYV
ncbi:MAG: hypothetical protein ACREBU_00305 [Nitrososphaera sp.]